MQEQGFLNPTQVLRAAKLREGSTVADFGCGGGFFARAAARLTGAHGIVWLVDANSDLLVRAKSLGIAEGLENMQVARGSIDHRGGSHLPDHSADFLIAANILFSSGNKSELVEEIHRVLKIGGRALVIDWKDSFGGLGPHKDHVVTEEAARKLFSGGGFSFEADIPAGGYHWGFTVKKK